MPSLKPLFLLLLLGVAQAQPLAELAPADAVLSLGWSSSYDVIDTLDDDFAALAWEDANDVLLSLSEALISLDADPDITDMATTLRDAFENGDDPYADIVAFCPEFEGLTPELEAYEDADMSQFGFEALATVSMSAFSPIPSATALLRIEGDEDYNELLVRLREVLLECYTQESGAEVNTLEQDGVTLYVVGNGGDFPFVAGNADNLFFLGTNPEAVRSALRKLNGADEPSLADSELYQAATTRFEATEDNLSISIDFAAAAEALEGVSGFVVDGPETEYLVNRGLAALRTLGGYVAQSAATSEGLVSESAFVVNPEGGDPALADYILCDDCRVSAPFLAPEGTSSVNAAYIPWRDLWRYAETWLSELSVISGENLDLRSLVEEELGLDLDVALFDWLGSEVHSYVLEPYSPELGTSLYGQAQVTVIPVSSSEAAQAGFDAWKDVFAELGGVETLLMDADPEMTQFLGMVAARPYEYQGHTINRVQFSVNGDIGYSFVGNYLVVGSPAAAVEQIIDTFEGARALSNPTLRELRSEAATVTTYGYADTSANLQGLTDISALLVQPAAFGTRLALDELSDDDSATVSLGEDVIDDTENFTEPYYADIEGINPELLAPGTQDGSIEESDLDNLDYNTDFYELTDLEVGSEVTVRLQSDDFDTYMWLIEAESTEYLDENDDLGEDTSTSEITFSVQEGERYWVELSSYNGDDLGDYTISVEAQAGTATVSEEDEPDDMLDSEDLLNPEDLPSFAELLNLYDLLPQSLQILTDHVGTSQSHSLIDGNTVYQRGFTEINW